MRWRRAASADASLVIADDSSFRRLLEEFTSGLSSRFRLVAIDDDGLNCRPMSDLSKKGNL